MKYIVIVKKIGSIEREFPIVFPNELTHIDVAEALISKCPELENGGVVGAGEMSCFDIDAHCHGRSSTLNVNSRESRDSESFKMRDYTAGAV